MEVISSINIKNYQCNGEKIYSHVESADLYLGEFKIKIK